MSLFLRFPRVRPHSTRADLVALTPDQVPGAASPTHIVVGLGDARVAGRWDDETGRVTALVSGRVVNVPAPLRAGAGETAARALCEGYAKYGNQIFALVDGAYSFAILDWGRGAIIVGHDKLGIARAYLSRVGDMIVFSDRLSLLRRGTDQPLELDIDSVHAFLVIGWVPTPRSMFRGVEKLRPGTYFESCDGTLSEIDYYDVPHAPDALRRRPAETLHREVAEHLDRAVDRGLAGGGRWGSFLSGGVDSSSVVSSLARANGGSFPTYFGGFAPELNRYLPNPEEPRLSQLVAERFHTKHHMLWLGPEAVETTPEIVRALEEPVCDGGCVVLSAVLKKAREEADGIMTGVGGDFLFTGERRHMVLNLLRYMRPVPDPILHSARWLSGQSLFAGHARVSQLHFDLTRLLGLRKLSIEAMYAGFFLQIEPSEASELLLPEVHAKLTRSPFEQLNEYFERSSAADPLSRFLYLDLKTHTPDHCVREVETLGRHFGISVHHPFLDAEFVDFAMSVPAADKVSGLKLKVPLKQAMRGRVPDEVLDRRKGGLGSPIRWWVTRPDGFVASVLSPANLERRGLFAPAAVERFRAATANNERDFTKLLWSLFTLELWMQEFVDR